MCDTCNQAEAKSAAYESGRALGGQIAGMKATAPTQQANEPTPYGLLQDARQHQIARISREAQRLADSNKKLQAIERAIQAIESDPHSSHIAEIVIEALR